ncbi:hypothetical protein K466DRAFT_347268 [Polyporus arcularius HHB13444]|uniref:Uncharacterized protein n=1 Tax=Polyporus arcularius HHB13444 TaxID=1314778 RepID=A0A5C3NV12_9APHY|nr:hypothetical protein K466DRAFT_347268 [Polyporus arcularius HHB13444]
MSWIAKRGGMGMRRGALYRRWSDRGVHESRPDVGDDVKSESESKWPESRLRLEEPEQEERASSSSSSSSWGWAERSLWELATEGDRRWAEEGETAREVAADGECQDWEEEDDARRKSAMRACERSSLFGHGKDGAGSDARAWCCRQRPRGRLRDGAASDGTGEGDMHASMETSRERGNRAAVDVVYIVGAAHSQTASMDSQSSPGRRPLPETSSRPAQPRPLSVKPQSSPQLTQSPADSSPAQSPSRVPRSSVSGRAQLISAFPTLHVILPSPRFLRHLLLRRYCAAGPAIVVATVSSRPRSRSMREKSTGNDWLAEVAYHGPDPDRPIRVSRPLPANPRPRLVADPQSTLATTRRRMGTASSVVCHGENMAMESEGIPPCADSVYIRSGPELSSTPPAIKRWTIARFGLPDAS